MYLMILDGGGMVLLKDITDDDLRATDNGYAELIDVSRADEPLRYFDGGWECVKGLIGEENARGI